MNTVFNKPQDNIITYKIRKIHLNGGEKGGAAARQLDINSNTRARQDMHAHGTGERCRHTITEAEKKTSPTFTTTCVQGTECRVDLDGALSLI